MKRKCASRFAFFKLSLIVCSVVLAIQAGIMIAQRTPEPKLAPVLNEGALNTIQGQYIVVFKPGTPRQAVPSAQERAKGLGGTVGHTYSSALIGFSAKLPPEAVQALRAMPGVASIEADQMGS